MVSGRQQRTLKGVGKGGGNWRNWDAEVTVGSGRTAEIEAERICSLKKKINFTKHSQIWDLVILKLRLSKTLIYSLCCAVAQTHYFLLILSDFVPIGRIIIILLYLSIFSGVVFPDEGELAPRFHQERR